MHYCLTNLVLEATAKKYQTINKGFEKKYPLLKFLRKEE